MMTNLLIDCHYLCYRAMFTVGDLSYEDKPTGVVFGFLNQLLQLAEKFDYPEFLFAWDSKQSLRREVYPTYKIKDKELTPEMAELLEVAKPQFPIIRTSILPRMGFQNSFIQRGLEADDIIAKIVKQYFFEEIVIISADNDLYQLLTPRVKMYNPKTKKFYTGDDFVKEFGITPATWSRVKALAGCDGDGVKGIKGIGEASVIKWMNGTLKGKKLQLIEEQKDKMYEVNLPLVKLPHPATKPIELVVVEELNFKGFENLCMDYGFQYFLKKGVYEKWRRILNA